jgi:hypothetical protein
MTIKYKYTVEGTAARGQTWSHSGEVSAPNAGAFTQAVDDAMRDSFKALTSGKAVYGKPGIGCRGPYCMMKLLIEEIK